MAKIAKVQEVAVDALKPYENNAKIHGGDQIEKLMASIEEFGFLSPCLIDRDMNIIAGHGRVMAAQELGMETVPCVFIEGLTDEQRRAYILADNRLAEFATWNMDLVNVEIEELEDMNFDISLTGFDVPDNWFKSRDRWDDSREKGNDEYNQFLDKFEQPKTTDDCYTPDNIYEAIVKYVEELTGEKKKKFIRPFYPGGDYQSENYEGKIVVDNPPFSILAEIVDFYIENRVKFFLFAPGLTTINYLSREDVSAICAHVTITYENGALIRTNFLTNMLPGIAVMTDPDLTKTIKEINKENEKALHRELPKLEYPYDVITSARLGFLSEHGEKLVIYRDDCVLIRQMDAQKERGQAIFGCGLLLSERAAAERAAAERAAAERAAAERAAAEVFSLSEREKELQKTLGGAR